MSICLTNVFREEAKFQDDENEMDKQENDFQKLQVVMFLMVKKILNLSKKYAKDQKTIVMLLLLPFFLHGQDTSFQS